MTPLHRCSRLLLQDIKLPPPTPRTSRWFPVFLPYLHPGGDWKATQEHWYPLNLTTNRFYLGYLQEYGWGLFTGTEMSQRQLHHHKPNPTWVTAHKAENCTPSRQFSWSEPLQTAQSVSAFSGGLAGLWFLGWSLCLFLSATWERSLNSPYKRGRGLVNPLSFRNFVRLSCFLPKLNASPFLGHPVF